ncbi:MULTISPECIES: hypothetical protein [Cellulophaga]|uniref:hypothetical protein n=1 Tax=Cellulophaga TaxID=104264 RepID=UPI0020903C46|nr:MULTISPECIES: hypothetical protein [Cellulophaga]
MILVFSSCDKLDELTKFDIDYDSHVTIESSTVVDLPFDVYTPDMETNSESEFEVNDTRKDLIEEILLKEITLTITSPETADFSFLESIEVYIDVEDLDEILIASKSEIDGTESVLELDLTDIDIQEYIKKDSFVLRMNTVTDEVMSQDHEIDVHSVFAVDAKILGL